MAKATSLADSLGKHLECAVCLEQYTEPKVLPCLHTFCKRCLQGLLNEKEAVFKIDCPTCRSRAEIPHGKIDSLPVNSFFNNLLTTVALHEDSGSCNLECDNCESGDPPVNRCTTCSHFLCEFCTQAHRRGRNSSSHSVMSLQEAKNMGSLAITKPAMCKEHEGEVIKLFCETCEEAICRDCTIVKHRDHKYTFVKDAFSEGKASLLKVLLETKTKVSVLEEAVDGVLKMKSNVQSCAEQTVQEVINCFNELIASLDSRRGKLIDQVEEFKKAKLQSLEIQQEELETALESERSSVEFTEKAFENCSEVEILNVHKQMKSRLQNLNSAKWQLEPCVNYLLNFKNDGQLKRGIVSFGSVTDVGTHAGMSTVTMGNGQEGVMYNTLCGQPVEFTITAKDWNGKNQNEGGDDFKVSIEVSEGNGTNVCALLYVRDCGNGRYSFCHTPVEAGSYKLSVELKGCHVQGSPFQWLVKKWNLQPFSLGSGDGQLNLSEQNLTAQYVEAKKPAVPSWENLSWHALASFWHDDTKPYAYRRASGEASSDRKHYAVGSVGFKDGKYMWKVQIDGKPWQGFSFGIINIIRNRNGKLVNVGNKWVWNAKQKQYPLLSGAQRAAASTITDCASGDIIELYLDFEDGKLRMYNPRTKQSDTWGGVKGEVTPVFHMATHGNKVSLKIPQKA